MARRRPSLRNSANALIVDEMGRSGNDFTITTDVEKELMRLLQCANNEPNNEHSRRNFESACETLSKTASKMSKTSLKQANLLSFCAKFTSAALDSKNISSIKSVLINLATWLLPETISRAVIACQQFGWHAIRDIYSIAVENQMEFGDACRIIKTLVGGFDDEVSQIFIDEQVAKLFQRVNILYASDVPELLWILRQQTNKDENQSNIFRLIQKNIRNSNFVAAFLNLLYWDSDVHLKAVTRTFFEQLLPIFALTFNFLPQKQPLHDVDDVDIDLMSEGEPNDSSDEEERLFNEWEDHWKHLNNDLFSEATYTNPAVETANGQRLYDQPLGGMEFAILIQAASQMGFTTSVKQMLELMVFKLGSLTPEQHHAILLAFLDTMLLTKLGRAILEKHEGEIRSILCSYIHHYLALPDADWERPRVECQCVRCKTLNKFLEDPQLESKIFVNETSGRHQHLLEQIQMANHRFTWEYRYGVKDELGGEKRRQFPNDWSYKLRRKRFPERWAPNKGYNCTTKENQHVTQLTIRKTDRRLTLAQENFQKKLKNAEKLQAKIQGSRLRSKLWTDAMISAQTIDQTEISQSQKLLKAEAAAKQLIDTCAKEVATQPVQTSALSTNSASSEPSTLGKPFNHATPTTAKGFDSQFFSQVATSQPTSKTSQAANLPHRTAETSLVVAVAAAVYTAIQTRNVGTSNRKEFPITTQNRSHGKSPTTPGGMERSQQQSTTTLSGMATRPGKGTVPYSSSAPQIPKGVAPTQKDQRPLSPKPPSFRSSQSSKRIVTNGQVTILNSDSESESDNKTSRIVYQRKATSAEVGYKVKGTTSRAPRPTTSSLLQSDSVFKSSASLISEPLNTCLHTGVKCSDVKICVDNSLRRMEAGEWDLSAEQIRIDLGPEVLFSAQFLFHLARISLLKYITREEAINTIKDVRVERRKSEEAKSIKTKTGWTPADAKNAFHLLRTLSTRKGGPSSLDPTAPFSMIVGTSVVWSPHSSPEPQLQPKSLEKGGIQSTTPPGDPPSTWRGFGNFASSPASVSKKASTGNTMDLGHSTKHPDKPVLPTTKFGTVKKTRPASTAQEPRPPTSPAPSSAPIFVPGRDPQSTNKQMENDITTRTTSPVAPAPPTMGPTKSSLGSTKASPQPRRQDASISRAILVIDLEDDDDDSSNASDANDGTTPGWPKEVKGALGTFNNAPAIQKIKEAGVILDVGQATKLKSMMKGDPSSAQRLTKSSLQKCLGNIKCRDHKSGRRLHYDDNWQPISASVEGREGGCALPKEPSSTTNQTSIPPRTPTTATNSGNKMSADTGMEPRNDPAPALAMPGNKNLITDRIAGTHTTSSRHTPSSPAKSQDKTTSTATELRSPSSASLQKDRAKDKASGAGGEVQIVPAAARTPLATSSGTKRNADAAGLSSSAGPAGAKRRTENPNKTVVIDLLDSDDEIPVDHLLEGSKRRPIALD